MKTLFRSVLTVALAALAFTAVAAPDCAVIAFLAQLLPQGDGGVILAMSTLAATHPTLLDLKSRLDASGNVIPVIEMLSQTNEIIEDAVFLEANELTGHTTSVRTGIPEPTWRKLYGGVQPSKTTSVKVREGLGMLENYAEVDKSLADLNGNSAAWRLSEDRAFVAGMSNTQARSLFYGDSSIDPEKFMGLAPRFSSLAAENGQNIIDAGGTGADNTSIWLVVWGPNTIHGIYPKASKAGLQTKDLGEVTLLDAAQGRYQGYRTHYKWDTGLTLRDWRYVVRIANIDVSDLKADFTTGGANLIDLMIQATELIPAFGNGRPVFYMPRKLRSTLRRQMINTKNVNLTLETVEGKRVTMFDEIPVRRTDAILLTEARVV